MSITLAIVLCIAIVALWSWVAPRVTHGCEEFVVALAIFPIAIVGLLIVLSVHVDFFPFRFSPSLDIVREGTLRWWHSILFGLGACACVGIGLDAFRKHRGQKLTDDETVWIFCGGGLLAGILFHWGTHVIYTDHVANRHATEMTKYCATFIVASEAPYVRGKLVVVDTKTRQLEPELFNCIPLGSRALDPSEVGTVVQIKDRMAKEFKYTGGYTLKSWVWTIAIVDLETKREIHKQTFGGGAPHTLVRSGFSAEHNPANEISGFLMSLPKK